MAVMLRPGQPLLPGLAVALRLRSTAGLALSRGGAQVRGRGLRSTGGSGYADSASWVPESGYPVTPLARSSSGCRFFEGWDIWFQSKLEGPRVPKGAPGGKRWRIPPVFWLLHSLCDLGLLV